MAAQSEYHSNIAEAGINPVGAFARADWFAMLHAECLPEYQPLVAAVTDGEARLWLAMMRGNDHTVRSLANWYSFDWRPIWGGQPDAGERLALLDEWASSVKTHGSALYLSPVPQFHADSISNALRRAGWFVSVDETSTNHWLETRGRSFADWWEARPGALRSTVQRKSKKRLVALEILTEFSDEAWDEFEVVYRASWKPAESHPDFLRHWAAAESVAGRLRLGIARVDGQAVAAQFWTVEDGIAYIHKLAHVSGQDALSPGTLLTHALFAHAFDADKVVGIDFGTGDDGYKRDWMEESAPLVTIAAWQPRSPRNWPALIRELLRRVAMRRRHG